MFSLEEYRRGLVAIKDHLSQQQLAMLRAHYLAPGKTITAHMLAEAIQYKSYTAINIYYGQIGRLLATAIGKWPPQRANGTHRWWMVVASGTPPNHAHGFLWTLHPELAQALEDVGLVSSQPPRIPEDDAHASFERNRDSLQASALSEPPARVLSAIYRLQRDTALSKQLKELHQYKCQLCHTSIELGNNRWYVEVHHIRPLGTPHNGPDIPENMLCVCPNHHVQLDYGAITLDRQRIRTVSTHDISQACIDYHNTTIHRKA